MDTGCRFNPKRLTFYVFCLTVLWVRACHSLQASSSYQVLRILPHTEDDVDFIQQLRHMYNLDPWRDTHKVNQSGDFLVRPGNADDVIGKLWDNSIDFEIIIADAEKFLQSETRSQRRRRDVQETSGETFRSKYLSYPEVLSFLNYAKTSPKVKIGTIGKTFEGRETPVIQISSNNSFAGKRAIFIDAGMHSREWISPAMAVEIVHRLAFNVEQDKTVDKLLELFDWIIVPLVNPDGYVKTFGKGLESRLWRKNRNKLYSSDSFCYGVDLNRNFGFQWNNKPGHGGSNNPCSGTFSGPRSFSEPETRNMRRLLLGNRDRIAAYVSFHSFGQFFLYPWGYSSHVDIEDEAELHRVASAFVEKMHRKNYEYNLGGTAKILYPAAGGSDDYVRGVVGVKYAYTVELPPHENSRYGFLLPEPEVMSVVSDTWEGVKSFAFRLHHYTKALPYTRPELGGVVSNKSSITNRVGLNNEPKDFSIDRNKTIASATPYRTVKENRVVIPMGSLLNITRLNKQFKRKAAVKKNKIRLIIRSKAI